VDCGTNSTRLIVVDHDGSVLEREMQITRLGEGVDATRRLAEAAIERTLAVLRGYRQVMDWRGVGRTRVVATSAARDALNAESFMKPVEEIIGVRPEVLPGREEGRLSFLGATARLPVSPAQLPLLVTDIGGGSTELSIGSPRVQGGPATAALATRSLDVGCVRVTERYLRHDPPRRDEVAEARAAVEKEVLQARDELPPLVQDSLLVGLAGTVSTLTSLVNGIVHYDRVKVHHSVIRRDEVEHWLSILASEEAEARLTHPAMVVGRQDVIVGGAIVLAAVMEVFGRDRCLVSEDDILDGMATELLTSKD
jgi:exopolyphosphatase/guanosine-5'-triphosphate,3'-diphosphate pyrophosphatase